MEFEGKLRYRMGTVEVDDQVDGATWLISQNLAIYDQIGITGWSYGGYMTLLALIKAPHIFRFGVAGAPVTDWKMYDTAYTERYMGTPEQNPDGYNQSSVLEQAGNLEGKLLIIHSLLDENVHFKHTARLVEILNAKSIEYDLVIFPSERHSPIKPTSNALVRRRTITFFQNAIDVMDEE